MPQQKDLKRLVRARMQKTGEAYTAARANIIRKPATPSSAPTLDYASLAGMSDAVIKEQTGCNWERWVYALDRLKAHELPHREIAQIVRTKYKVKPWWTQAVTVGYERIKGLRERGQRRNGTFEMSRSRTYAVPVKHLFDAWHNPRKRAKWLTGGTVKIRTATSPKSMRLDWSNGGILAVNFTSKGPVKSAVAMSHEKLPDKETANRLKEYWSAQLDALGETLAPR